MNQTILEFIANHNDQVAHDFAAKYIYIVSVMIEKYSALLEIFEDACITVIKKHSTLYLDNYINLNFESSEWDGLRDLILQVFADTSLQRTINVEQITYDI